ncbi:amino acid ABC transporter permease [Telmatospirillum sp.]|uniref:amino acid ABC transporter permease n=1 Tax=Telmatospirillum sp. TaxID=2079197 RepID=UPI00283CA66E|nr:amino acid ABC transporter permease [Telmatospirillum sp.]MDR3436961.1 amino acid ABC transporter permease [Telmatospirillum sp.]
MTYVFQFGDVWRSIDELLWGGLLTIELSLGGLLFGLALAVLSAYARMTWPRVATPVVGAYVEAIRNTPLLVQVFLIFFGLPALGVRLSADQAALFALSVNFGAYATEILRSGLESVPAGQVEAGLALGLKRWQVFVKVEMFQAMRVVFPALSSQFILLLLGSSIVSAIAAREMTAAANDVQSRTFRSFEVYLVVTAFYFVIATVFSTMLEAVDRLVFRRQDRPREVS